MIIHWNEIGKEAYEDMVAVLLSRLHPEIQRIDGAGGDGGRDVQLEDDAGLHAWQLKSFSDRIKPVQRRQIVRSLTKAARLKPVDWTLVVPVDPTHGELSWFQGLRKTVPFPIAWRGKTWLEGHLAEHECVRATSSRGRGRGGAPGP